MIALAVAATNSMASGIFRSVRRRLRPLPQRPQTLAPLQRPFPHTGTRAFTRNEGVRVYRSNVSNSLQNKRQKVSRNIVSSRCYYSMGKTVVRRPAFKRLAGDGMVMNSSIKKTEEG